MLPLALDRGPRSPLVQTICTRPIVGNVQNKLVPATALWMWPGSDTVLVKAEFWWRSGGKFTDTDGSSGDRGVSCSCSEHLSHTLGVNMNGRDSGGIIFIPHSKVVCISQEGSVNIRMTYDVREWVSERVSEWENHQWYGEVCSKSCQQSFMLQLYCYCYHWICCLPTL